MKTHVFIGKDGQKLLNDGRRVLKEYEPGAMWDQSLMAWTEPSNKSFYIKGSLGVRNLKYGHSAA